MRLSEYEKEVIVSSAKNNFGGNTRVILFGSRTNDARKGGDIDLFVQLEIWVSPEEMLKKKISMQIEIEQKLGEQKIDIIIQQINDNRAIVKTAKRTGIAVC
jgi:predicted nucleotidyltransferase